MEDADFILAKGWNWDFCQSKIFLGRLSIHWRTSEEEVAWVEGSLSLED